MNQKGFAPIFVLVGALVLAVLGVSGYFIFKSQTKEKPSPSQKIQDIASLPKQKQEKTTSRLSTKPLNEPNYLVYIKKVFIERLPDQPETSGKYKYSVITVDETGGNRKELISYIRTGIGDQVFDSMSELYGADSFVLKYINTDKDFKIFNKNGENKDIVDFYQKYPLRGAGFSRAAFSTDNKSYAYLKHEDFESPTKIAVLNLETKTEKVYKLLGNYDENGPLLYFSSDNKKLYVCGCAGFYYRGPSAGMWEIDLVRGEVKSLDYINKLKIRDALFRYDLNSIYGAHFEEFDPGFEIQGEGIVPQRSKTLYKFTLETQELAQFDFNNYFYAIDVSPNGLYVSFSDFSSVYNQKYESYLKNLKTNEEYTLEGKAYSWSDNDKTALSTKNNGKIQLFIYNPKDKTKLPVDVTTREQDSIDVIGWIH